MSDLQKTIGPWSLVAIGAAGIVGSSYLYLSSSLFESFTFGGVLLGMTVATLLASCVAVGIAELAAMFPRAGGEFVYAYVGFGRFTSFIVGWLLISIYSGIIGFYITATGRLLSSVFPQLESVPLYDIGGGQMYLPILVIGLGLVGGTMVMNWFGTQMSFNVQLFLFIVLIAIGLVIAAVAFSQGSYENTKPLFGDGSTRDGVLSGIAFIIPALGFLSGFSVVAALAEEADVSRRKLGKLIVASVLIAGAFYTVIFYATGWIIPWQETTQLTNGTIEAFQVAGYPIVAILAFIAGFVGIITTVIAVFSSASRLMFALSRAGMLPSFLGKVDKKTGVPRTAVLATGALGLIYGLLGPDALQWILNVGGLYVAMVWIFTAVAFYTIRRKHPDKDRPYRVRFTVLPAVGGFAGVGLVLFTVIPSIPFGLQHPLEYALAAALLGIGLVLYIFAPRNLSPEQEQSLLLGELDPNNSPNSQKEQPTNASELPVKESV